MTTDNKTEDKTECVGTLLVHGKDVQELSAAGTTAAPGQQAADECVGSLLVHQKDVQELAADATPPSKDECVGTLLVHQKDVQELSDVPNVNVVNIKKRITKTIQNMPLVEDPDDVLKWQAESDL